jgi:hypothetical protein
MADEDEKKPPIAKPVARREREDDFDDEDDERPRSRRRDEEETEEEGDGTGGLIPFKNPKALTAYYVGVFNLILCIIPVLGLIGGIVAIVLGKQGLTYAKKHPRTAGQAHAVVGILLGAFVIVCQLAMVGFMVFAIATK